MAFYVKIHTSFGASNRQRLQVPRGTSKARIVFSDVIHIAEWLKLKSYNYVLYI